MRLLSAKLVELPPAVTDSARASMLTASSRVIYIFSVALHHARLRHTQDRVFVVRIIQIREFVLCLGLVIHYAVYDNRHVCSCYGTVRFKVSIVALDDTAVAPAADRILRPVPARIRK